MARRGAPPARLLGLWTAGWLAVFLVAGLLWLGDLSLQWPVLLVPVLWALVALRRRGPDASDGYDDEDHWEPVPRPAVPPAHRTDTVERPAFDGRYREEGSSDPLYREDR